MAYASWSVVFGEQPSAAKWNILGTNDSSFNDGTGIFGLYKNLLATDSNPYKFRVSMNAAANSGNGAFAQIVFDTEQYDTNSNFASGTYTAPVTGFYQFNWGLQFAANSNNCIGSLYKNGSEYSRGSRAKSSAAVSGSTGSDIISLAATDTVRVYAYADTTTALDIVAITNNFFSGFLVSRT